MDSVEELLTRQIHFVSGKGGVGKSVVACALADRFAEDGHQTLLVQVNAPDSHSALLGIPPVTDEVVEARPNLYVVNTTPAASLKEYALIVLKFETIYRAAFENRLARAFLRFIPSLAELTMLGKIWHHAEELGDDEGLRFSRVVVDSPSTGHGLGFLRVAKVVHDVTGGRGPMAEKTAEMQTTFSDPRRACLHVVTLPEEMPTNEALEFIAAARRDATTPLGACIVNAVTRPFFTSGDLVRLDDVLASPADELLSAALDAADRRIRREHLELEHLARLEPGLTGLPRIDVPNLATPRFGLDEIRTVATHLFGEER